MRKKLVLRCLAGAPLGLTISVVITLAISLAIGDGCYYPVVPELAAACGSELAAVLLQTVISMLYGALWAGASIVWEREHWSLLRQTMTHLAVCSIATLPIAYLLRWMEPTAAGIAKYFGIFFGIYLLVWLWQYGNIKRRLRQINEKMNNAGD